MEEIKMTNEEILNFLRSAVYDSFSVFQAESGDFTNCFDNLDLLSADILQDYVCLLYTSWPTVASPPR